MMELRKANAEDIPKLRLLFEMIAGGMRSKNIYVWHEGYPVDHFEEDIASGTLWIFERSDGMPMAAFSMSESKEGAEQISWSDPTAKAMYIERLGVYRLCSDCHDLDLVFSVLHRAARIARDSGAEYLRLLEIHGNTPAMTNCLHSGFRFVEGDMTEKRDGCPSLWLHGFEMKL